MTAYVIDARTLMEKVRALRVLDLIEGVEGRTAEYGSFKCGVDATKRVVVQLILDEIKKESAHGSQEAQAEASSSQACDV